jgi:D-tyrosyl-tRNA(Tyr) deacylase
VNTGSKKSKFHLYAGGAMKAVVQRVARASVVVEGNAAGEIGAGLLVFLGVVQGDAPAQAELLAGKIARLRVFEDDQGKMNRSLLETHRAALVVSQFTLCANLQRGNRPSFAQAEAPGPARAIYEHFCGCLQGAGVQVRRGVFGANMQVELLNQGPVTIVMDTNLWEN